MNVRTTTTNLIRPPAFVIAALAILAAIAPEQAFGQGACCIFPGNCELLAVDECVDRNGFFNGNGSSCFDGACQPQGACCSDTGCDIRTEQDCNASGLTYQGNGLSCADAACSIVGGGGGNDGDNSNGNDNDNGNGIGSGNDIVGCCLPTDECVDLTRDECRARGGGENVGPCDLFADECTEDTPCCFEDFFCDVVTPLECADGGEIVADCMDCDELADADCTFDFANGSFGTITTFIPGMLLMRLRFRAGRRA